MNTIWKIHAVGGSAVALVLSLAAPALADVFAYECDTFPGEARWTVLNEFCHLEQWIEAGVLHQRAEPCPRIMPPAGQGADYRRSLTDFLGVQEFFVEWRVQTDGHRSEIAGVAPAALVAWGTTTVAYHFTIARDQVRLIFAFLPELYIDVEPDMPHTYRLELYGAVLYVWYIDGVVADSGTPEAAFLTDDSFNLNWRTKSWFLENETQWDYIRYGTIAADGSGDFNSDGEVDFGDWPYFEECFSDPDAGSWPGCRWADFDFDTDVDCVDALAFLAAWTDPADPPELPECNIPADLDGDGQVRVPDLIILLGAWGPCPEPCEAGDPEQTCPADLDGDCQVRVSDLIILLASWG